MADKDDFTLMFAVTNSVVLMGLIQRFFTNEKRDLYTFILKDEAEANLYAFIEVLEGSGIPAYVVEDARDEGIVIQKNEVYVSTEGKNLYIKY
jgi:hypothetical protein